MEKKLYDKIYGCLLGGLIGDAMGGPSEGMTYQMVKEKFGWIDEFDGCGTDDTVIKTILTDAILENRGNVTADEWAEAFLKAGEQFYPLYYAPVRNMYHKLQSNLILPVYAGDGNSPSSSSAMAIAPMGIINACNPRRAAAETYDAAGLIHAGAATFCRDGACAIAAAVAEALKADTTVDAIIDAATAYLHKKSSAALTDLITESVDMVRAGMDYEAYREWFYKNCLQSAICDARETIPATFAVFLLAKGDVETAAVYAANLGRDSDTIGTMAASIAGAFNGASSIRKGWVEQIEGCYHTVLSVSSSNTEYGGMQIEVQDYRDITRQFVQVIRERNEEQRETLRMVEEQL